ncbi:hypothetical protein PMAYCL1PPCAC_10974, partial [Pristionchus mayeri]
RVQCHAGIWILQMMSDPKTNRKISNGTCAPPKQNARTNMTAEMGVDPCVQEFFPAETAMFKNGVCTRDERKLVIR